MNDYRFQPRGLKEEFGWYQGKNLPHFDAGELTQFITFRLCDSMPHNLLEKWRAEAKTDAAFRRRVEKFLDSGYGECWLKTDAVATMMQNALLFHHDGKYRLHAWVIMPNHGHVLLTPLPGRHLDEITHSIKSYTAHEANKLLGRTGQFWQPEGFDRYIRNLNHFAAVVRYIHRNPVKAGLCKDASDWKYSSDWSGNDWSGGPSRPPRAR